MLIPNPAVPGDDAEFEYEGNAVPTVGLSAFGELYVIVYPLAALVDAAIVDIPKLAAPVPIGAGNKSTDAAASVNVNVSSTLAFTVMIPAVEVATVPVSITPVKPTAEYVVMRRKNVELSALGFTTAPKLTVAPADGEPVFDPFEARSDPAVAVLTTHVPPDPSPVTLDSVEDASENPAGGLTQAPDAAVHALNSTDCTVVPLGAVNVKL
jgi:hypothetical protein